MAEYDAVLQKGEHCIYAFWHAQMLPLAFTHRDRGVAVLVSRHRDGEWIARVLESLGYVTARGSSTRGGGEGAREMLLWAERGHLLAITPDGPRGPRGQVKPGLLYLARRTGWPVLPLAAWSEPSWVARSWDRFRVPLPWARTVVVYGDPIRVPGDLSAEAEEQWRARLEAALDQVTRRARAMLGGKP